MKRKKFKKYINISIINIFFNIKMTDNIISNIEVYSCLNPLYYTILNTDLNDSNSYEIFKNLSENALINLNERLNLAFNELLFSNRSGITNKNGIFVEDSPYLDRSDGTILTSKLINEVFYGSQNFNENYIREPNTLFLYIETFDNDLSLRYKQKTPMEIIYSNLTHLEKKEEKQAFKIRVYSKNVDINKDILKKTIDLDIENFVAFIEQYDSKKDVKNYNKVRIITDFDGNLDFHALNINKIKLPNERKKLIEMVEYANNKLKTLFSSEIKKDRDGKVVGKTKFFIYPTIQKPSFIDKKINIREFLNIIENNQIKDNLKIQKNIESAVEEFKKILTNLKEKLIRGESIKELGDFLKTFYELEIYLGLNGDNLINITKQIHDTNFRYKKNNYVILSLNALDVELIGKVIEIQPTGFFLIEIYALLSGNIQESVAFISASINYQTDKNTFKIEKFSLNYKNISYLYKNSDYYIEKYKEFFQIKNKLGDEKSSLIGRSGIIKRKVKTPKNVLKLEIQNLINTNLNKPIYIIPLISFDDKDVALFLKKDDVENYIIEPDDLLNILIDTEKAYKFYLSVSLNDQRKVFDKDEYSNTFKDNKIKENVNFILSRIFKKGNVFRPKILSKDKEKPFKGIYKILNYELQDNGKIVIIDDRHYDKPEQLNEVQGVLIEKNKQYFLQLKDYFTFVTFNSNIIQRQPPLNKMIKLIDSSLLEGKIKNLY